MRKKVDHHARYHPHKWQPQPDALKFWCTRIRNNPHLNQVLARVNKICPVSVYRNLNGDSDDMA